MPSSLAGPVPVSNERPLSAVCDSAASPYDPASMPFEIMLVEDADPDVFLVREALELGGLRFSLRVFDDGEKAVEVVDGVDRDEGLACPHLVLLDLNLPKKTGAEVWERVRRSPRCGEVPVIILTSSDSPRDREQVARLGATKYFRKPSRLAEFMRLGDLVRDVLGG